MHGGEDHAFLSAERTRFPLRMGDQLGGVDGTSANDLPAQPQLGHLVGSLGAVGVLDGRAIGAGEDFTAPPNAAVEGEGRMLHTGLRMQ